MKIKQVSLETVCGVTSILPENTLPEVAFAGKSNVGKSSLINCLMQRKKLARTSAEPGKTQTINFYNVNGELYLVDLPGYGYAKVSRTESARWGKMIERYLNTSQKLSVIFLLIDIRRDPDDLDRQMFDWIEYGGFQPIIIATKSDKIKRSALTGRLNAIRRGLGADDDVIIEPFSSVTGAGRDSILDFMQQVIDYDAAEEAAEADVTEEKGREA